MAAVLFLLVVEGTMAWYCAIDAARFRVAVSGAATHVIRPAAASRRGPTESDEPRIGVPFRVSPSVTEDCRQTPRYGCERLEDFLGAMAGESRDTTWAPRTEARLAQLWMRGGRGSYSIRSLECRQSRCAVEIASPGDYPPVSLIPDDSLDRELQWSGSTVIAWEVGAASVAPTTVTVATWSRRASIPGRDIQRLR